MSAERRDEWLVVTDDAKTVPVIEILTGRGFITGKSGSGKSVLEGTIVYTANGRKAIEDVRKGELVLSLNKHDFQQEFREVRATIDHQTDDLLRITLEDGSRVVGTPDHSFLTIQDREIVPIRGDQLENGTWLPLASELPAVERVHRIDLAAYVRESWAHVDIAEETIRCDEATEDRFVDLDAEAGQVVGLYLANGSVTPRLTVSIPAEHRGVRRFLETRGFGHAGGACVHSFRPFGAFLQAEFDDASGGKSLPDWVFAAPAAFKAGLLSGYLDGAGTFEDTAQVTAPSRELSTRLQELFKHFGIATWTRARSTGLDNTNRREHALGIDASSLERVLEIADFLVEEHEVAVADLATAGRGSAPDRSPILGAILDRAAAGVATTTHPNGPRTDGGSVTSRSAKGVASGSEVDRDAPARGRDSTCLEGSHIQWRRIIDIKEFSERRAVYDLDVRGNDNFIANGVFVHNSNTAGVFAEELLANGYNLLIVDTEGEYFGLKERYEVLHVGGDEFADVEVGPGHAEKIAEIAIGKNMPVILDVSGYDNAADARALIASVLRHIYDIEKQQRKPFLIMVEEMQEYLPQQGSGGDLGELLERIAKRGRKRGLGLCGMSQRPSSVDKDFITQCDWMVWHRLTWETDINVVRNILGSERAAEIQEFDRGQGILMTEWDDTVETVTFRRKQTHDAGATPGLESYERPDLQAIGSELIREIKGEGAVSEVDEITRPEFTTDPEEPMVSADALTDGLEEAEPLPDEELPEEPGELHDRLSTERRRNEVLTAEVEELRSILAGVKGEDAAPTIGERRSQPSIEPPMPPRRPPNRSGVAGNLVEFGQMMVYLARSTWYRIRVRYLHR